MSSLLALDLSGTFVRPSHFDLAAIKTHNFMQTRKDTVVFLGIDSESEEVRLHE